MFYAIAVCLLSWVASVEAYPVCSFNSCEVQCNSSCDPWYVFAGIVHTGLFDDRYRTSEVTVGLGTPFLPTEGADHSNSLGWQAFLGYEFIPWFGLELGYVDLNKQRVGERILDGVLVCKGHYRNYVVPLRSRFSVHFGGLSLSLLAGIHYYHSKGSLSSPPLVVELLGSAPGYITISRNKAGMDFNVGAVIEYKFIDWLGLRIDATRYYIKRYDPSVSPYTDALSANLVTYF